MKLGRQFLEVEKVYQAVEARFNTRCCLDWDKKKVLLKEFYRTKKALERLKEIYINSDIFYEKYLRKIRLRYYSLMWELKNHL